MRDSCKPGVSMATTSRTWRSWRLLLPTTRATKSAAVTDGTASPVQSECYVPHQNALFKALHLSSQHVQMFCHSPFPVALPPLKDHIVWRLSQEGFSEQADGRCQIIGRKPNKEKGCLKINAEWCATYITDRHHRTTRVTRVTFPVCRGVSRSMRTSWWCIPGASLVTARWISGRC